MCSINFSKQRNMPDGAVGHPNGADGLSVDWSVCGLVAPPVRPAYKKRLNARLPRNDCELDGRTQLLLYKPVTTQPISPLTN